MIVLPGDLIVATRSRTFYDTHRDFFFPIEKGEVLLCICVTGYCTGDYNNDPLMKFMTANLVFSGYSHKFECESGFRRC